MEVVYLSILLVLCAVLVCLRCLRSRILATLIAITVFVALLLAGFFIVADSISGAGVNEAVLYHLFAELKGAGYLDFWSQMLFAGLYTVGIIIISIVAYRLILGRGGFLHGSINFAAATVLLALAIFANPVFAALELLHRELLISHLGKINASGRVGVDLSGTSPPEHFLQVSEINLPANSKNIVYLYLEGVEYTYFDEAIFPGLVPNLKRLEQQALSFTEINDAIGTGWTIAGMVASQCGIPLFISAFSGRNNMKGIDQFMSGAYCLGDLLQQHNYDLQYLGGASTGFAGKEVFYANHGFNRIEGLEELTVNLHDKEYVSTWGLYDDSIFTIAKQRYQMLAKGDKPFGLFLLTLDTHHPRGQPSASCDGIVYQDGSNQMLNAVHCSDHLAADYINYILQHENAEDTLLIVASDHIAIHNEATGLLNRGERRNLLFMFNSGEAPRKSARAGSSFDIAPTVLNFMGAQLPGMGFGRDLLAEAPTIFEQHDPQGILESGRNYVRSLWSPPQIGAALKVSTSLDKLIMQDRKIQLPVLLLLNSRLTVTDIGLGIHSKEFLARAVYNLKYDQRFIWVDKCIKNGYLGDVPITNLAGYCAVIGAPGSREMKTIPLRAGLEISFAELEDIFASEAISSVTVENYEEAFLGLFLAELLN